MKKLLTILFLFIAAQSFGQRCPAANTLQYPCDTLGNRTYGSYDIANQWILIDSANNTLARLLGYSIKSVTPCPAQPLAYPCDASGNGTWGNWDALNLWVQFDTLNTRLAKLKTGGSSYPIKDSAWTVFGNNNITSAMFLGSINDVILKLKQDNVECAQFDGDDQNTSLGSGAGYGNVGGGGANTCVGYSAGGALTTGSENTVMGSAAGSTLLKTGNNNVLIGYDVDVAGPATTNATCVNCLQALKSNQAEFGNNTDSVFIIGGHISIWNGTAFTTGSSGQVLTSGGGGGSAHNSWTTPTTGTVTSVAATVPSVLSISGSPITTSGTLTIGYSGTALPIANGGTNATSFATSGALDYYNGTSIVSSKMSQGSHLTTALGIDPDTLKLPNAALGRVGTIEFHVGTNDTSLILQKLASGSEQSDSINMGSWKPWAATGSGFSSYFDSLSVYSMVGKTAYCNLTLFGTSNATTFSVTLPRAAKYTSINAGMGTAENAGTVGQGFLRTNAGSTTAIIATTNNSTLWTNTGVKGIWIYFFYETK